MPKNIALQQAALFALGWIISKHGKEAAPVRLLARALKDAGNECEYLDEALKEAKKGS